jgi:GDPmannose 4,6-dehydratase
MWLMLQHTVADDYIVATGEPHSVRDFVEAAFDVVDLPWRQFVKQSAAFARPADPTLLVGSSAKIRQTLGWRPAGSFKDLVREMVEAELHALDAAAQQQE